MPDIHHVTLFLCADAKETTKKKKKRKRILAKFNFDKEASLESLRAIAKHREKRRAENEGR